MKKKMKRIEIKTIKYERIHNLGNYENERVEIEVKIPNTSDGTEELRQAKQLVLSRLGIKTDAFEHPDYCCCDECMK